MNGEVIVEEGIVVAVEKGFAFVVVTPGKSCDDCSAKIICKSKSTDENILKVIDLLGVEPRSKVRFEVKGAELLGASFSLYGVPLILLLVGIFLGLSIFSQYPFKEFYSFLFGLGLILIYFLLKFFIPSKNGMQILPKIISVETKL